MEEGKRRLRRPHSAELKVRILSECAAPGASIARIALAHGLNANLVHKWRRRAGVTVVRKDDERCDPAAVPIKEVDKIDAAAGGFIALALPSPKTAPATTARDIRIELHRSATTVAITWPVDAAADCAAWLSAWLR